MANKQVISVVAASVLAAAFTFTGCGSSSSSSDTPASSSSSSVSSSTPASSSSSVSSSTPASSSSSVSSSSSSAPAELTTVKVSDAYVINANVTVGGTALGVEVGDGVYEAAQALSGAIMVKNGVNDLNGNNVVDTDENNNSEYDVVAVTLQAPEGYANVNPFTTLKVLGLTDTNAAKIFPKAVAIDPTFDFDVVANPEVANEVLIAALSVQNTAAAAQRDILPGGSSSSTSTSTSSSSSSVAPEDCAFDSGDVLPGATPVQCDGITFPSQADIKNIQAMDAAAVVAEFRKQFAVAGSVTSSSSSTSSCGEGSDILPDGSCGTTPSSSSSSVTSSSSSSTGGILPQI